MTENTTKTDAARDAGQSTAPMTHAEALAKAAKLLRLAKSSNPHEAALAAAKAQDIMDRFKLSGADITLDSSAPAEKVMHCPQDPLDRDGAARWKGQLAMAVAKLNQCKVYADPARGYCLIGRPSDMDAVRYLYAWLTQEIERLAASHCAGCGRTYWNNFRLGAVETVSARLRESARETVAVVKQEAAQSVAAGNAMALVLVEKSLATIEAQVREVEDYGKRVLHLRSRSRSGSNYNSDARAAGRRAGQSINIGNRAALGTSLRLA
jgi:hypothetical protein